MNLTDRWDFGDYILPSPQFHAHFSQVLMGWNRHFQWWRAHCLARPHEGSKLKKSLLFTEPEATSLKILHFDLILFFGPRRTSLYCVKQQPF